MPDSHLSHLYFLCRVSPWPVMRNLAFSWLSMTVSCSLYSFVTKSYKYGIANHGSVCALNVYIALLTYFMVRDIIWKADSHSACQKIACFLYGSRRFIIVFTKAHHRNLPWAKWIQFAPLIPISLRSSLMLSSHLRLGLSQWSLTLRPPNQNPVNTSPCLPHVPHTSSSLI
jgi:hypothetical protein